MEGAWPSVAAPPSAAVLDNGVGGRGTRATGRTGDFQVTDVPVSRELVQYYRSLVDHFERERAEYLQRLEGIEVSAGEMHRLKWELRKREEEIAELQKTLSDTQVYFMEEREYNVKLQAENDALKIQELEDRKRIRDLLSVSQPIQEDITFFRGSKPERTRYYPLRRSDSVSGPETMIVGPSKGKKGSSQRPQKTTVEYEDLVQRKNQSMSLRRREKADREAQPDTYEQDNYSRSRMVPGQTYASERLGAQKPNKQGILPPRKDQPELVREVPVNSCRILRTVTIPNDHTDALILTIESLRSQLEEQERVFGEQKRTLMDDRRVLMEESRTREDYLRSEMLSLEEDNKKLREMLRKNTSEFLHLRHNAATAQRALREELAGSVLMNKELLEKLEIIRHGKMAESETVAKTAEEKCEQFMHHFRKQAVNKEEELAAKLQEFVDRESDLKARIERQREKIKAQKKSYQDLEKRRMFDMMGFRNDVLLLNKHIRQLEVKFQRLWSGQIPGMVLPVQRSGSVSHRGAGGDSEEEKVMLAINEARLQGQERCQENFGVGISTDLSIMRGKLDKMVRDFMQGGGASAADQGKGSSEVPPSQRRPKSSKSNNPKSRGSKGGGSDPPLSSSGFRGGSSSSQSSSRRQAKKKRRVTPSRMPPPF